MRLIRYPHCGDAYVGAVVEFSHYMFEVVCKIVLAILKKCGIVHWHAVRQDDEMLPPCR